MHTDDGHTVVNSTLPTLPLTSQQLEHSAARDRISVKNKRRQPLKQKVIERHFFIGCVLNVLFLVKYTS